MTTVRRAGAAILLSVMIVGLLTFCTPPTFAWGFLGTDSQLKVALCSSPTVSIVRVSVSSERSSGEALDGDSAVWSGPRIHYAAGAVLDASALPSGWKATNDLDLSGDAAWERIVIELYDGDRYVHRSVIDRSDLTPGRWSLSPAPGLMAGTSDCPTPIIQPFEEAPALEEASYETAVADARAIAMPLDDFWEIIESAGSEGSAEREASVDNLEQVLSTREPHELIAFHAQLMLQYHELDTAVVWKENASRHRQDEYASTARDTFLALRSAIILGGRESVAAARAGESFPVEDADARLSSLPQVVLTIPEPGRALESTGAVALALGMNRNQNGW